MIARGDAPLCRARAGRAIAHHGRERFFDFSELRLEVVVDVRRSACFSGGRSASGGAARGSGWPSYVVIWQERRAASSAAHVRVAASVLASGPTMRRRLTPRDLLSRTATNGCRPSNRTE